MITDRFIIWLWANRSKILLWLGWFSVTLGGAIYFGLPFFTQAEQAHYLPAPVNPPHHQLQDNCQVCHEPFKNTQRQEACLNCHEKELEQVNDSHSISKFNDPRYHTKLQKLDASRCITCHAEHTESSDRHGVTVAKDFCQQCHGEIQLDLRDHKNFKFDSCQQCHNYHDNTVLYKDFLKKHHHQADTDKQAALPTRNLLTRYQQPPNYTSQPLNLLQQDSPIEIPLDIKIAEEWENGAHAQAGINCTQCHQNQKTETWIKKPSFSVCQQCHKHEYQGFIAGQHGIRLKHNMPALQIAEAQLPMQANAAKLTLSCSSCHQAHRFSTKHAAVEACLVCHADQHSLAYKKSPHYQLWEAERRGELKAGQGVSCASCHLPRLHNQGETWVEHNQNAHLYPNEKMLKTVCMTCHGAEFSLTALNNEAMVQKNFTGKVSHPVSGFSLLKK